MQTNLNMLYKIFKYVIISYIVFYKVYISQFNKVFLHYSMFLIYLHNSNVSHYYYKNTSVAEDKTKFSTKFFIYVTAIDTLVLVNFVFLFLGLGSQQV